MEKRKVPLRKCIITQEMFPKQELIRIVRNKAGEVFVDPTGKQNGRGAYLKLDLDIINKAEESAALNKQLQMRIPGKIYEELRNLLKDSSNE